MVLLILHVSFNLTLDLRKGLPLMTPGKGTQGQMLLLGSVWKIAVMD